jgi:hypothetical protein
VLAQRLPFDELGGDEVIQVSLPDVVNRQDVRMVQCRNGAPLSLEAPQAIFVCREMRRQQLERDFAAQLRVLCKIDLSHAALAKQADEPVLPDSSPRPSAFRKQFSGKIASGPLDETAGFFVRCYERLDFSPQLLVFSAGFGHEGGTLAGLALYRVVEQSIYLLPALALHLTLSDSGQGSQNGPLSY